MCSWLANWERESVEVVTTLCEAGWSHADSLVLGLGYKQRWKFEGGSDPDRLTNSCNKFMRISEKSTEIALVNGKSASVTPSLNPPPPQIRRYTTSCKGKLVLLIISRFIVQIDIICMYIITAVILIRYKKRALAGEDCFLLQISAFVYIS